MTATTTTVPVQDNAELIAHPVLLLVANRYSANPRQRFLQVTVALTALSCVPSLMGPPDAASKIALVAAHLIAAAVIVPVLARQAHR